MQRDKKSLYPKIKKYKPILFWEECRFCGKEFKKELGYVIKELGAWSSGGVSTVTTYCCRRCAPTEDILRIKLDQEKIGLEIMRNNPPKERSGIK